MSLRKSPDPSTKEQAMPDANPRKPLSAKLRFEVFKRDKFQCQYCGASSPEAVLHCDHINPVVEGGTNDVMNLITSCSSCNLGKGRRLIGDDTAVSKQIDQIRDLQERREQLDMLLQWRDAEQREKVDLVSELCARVSERSGGFTPNESGKSFFVKWLKKHPPSRLLSAIDRSFDLYMTFDGDKPNKKSVEVSFAKIAAMLSIIEQEEEKPYIGKILYIQGILRKRLKHSRLNCVEALSSWHTDDGLSLLILEMEAKHADNWDGFRDRLNTIVEKNESGGAL